MTQQNPDQRMLDIRSKVLSNHRVSSGFGEAQEDSVRNLDLSIRDVPLGNRFGTVGKWLVKFRKLGFNLFARWYVLPAFRQQESNNYRLADAMFEIVDGIDERVAVAQRTAEAPLNDLRSEVRQLAEQATDLVKRIDTASEAHKALETLTNKKLSSLVERLDILEVAARHQEDRLSSKLEMVENDLDVVVHPWIDRATQSLGEAESRLDELEKKVKAQASQMRLLKGILAQEDSLGDKKWSRSQMSSVFSKFVAPVDEIARGFEQYLPHLMPAQSILDVGSGTGALFYLLEEAGYTGTVVGVDINPVAVEACKGLGYRVACADVFDYMDDHQDVSFDAVFCAHILEHLQNDSKVEFLRKIRSLMRPNARLIVETPNVMSAYVLTHLYYLDASHQQPLHPEAYRLMFEDCGFKTLVSGLTMPIHAPGGNDEDSQNYYNYSWVGKIQ